MIVRKPTFWIICEANLRARWRSDLSSILPDWTDNDAIGGGGGESEFKSVFIIDGFGVVRVELRGVPRGVVSVDLVVIESKSTKRARARIVSELIVSNLSKSKPI